MSSDEIIYEANNSANINSITYPVVGVGASAGGLDAFKKFFNAIPANSGVAYVVMQHLKASPKSILSELLQKATNIPVIEITDNITIEPNHIYVIPNNKLLLVKNHTLHLSPRKNSDRLNTLINDFFISLANNYQKTAIGVILSGTGTDGTAGLRAIKENGGLTFAQDETTAAYDNMPKNAIQEGVVDYIYPPEKIAQKIFEVVNNEDYSKGLNEHPNVQEAHIFKQIITFLRLRKGIDFTYYKQTTIRRRILRRMDLNKLSDLSLYLQYLRNHKEEVSLLYQDLLIPVTSFFRDPSSFNYLCKTIFPKIINNKAEGEVIRIWIAGCSTGQEAYSVAICLTEIIKDKNIKIQLFATDISEPAIAKARSGFYTKNEIENISSKRLKEFFKKTTTGYQINRNIRNTCVFSAHNFLVDPPFSRIDFLSCRNVLIYMEAYLQKKALTGFHYSLNPNGYMLLGKSETISSVPDLFSNFMKTEKLYVRKDVSGKTLHIESQYSEQHNTKPTTPIPMNETNRIDYQKTTDDIVLSKYSSPGVVVNEAWDIVHFRSYTGNYLELSPGKPSLNILKLAKGGLSFELRNLLHKAKNESNSVSKENISFEINGEMSLITIEAIPLTNTIDPHYLVLFHKNTPSSLTSSKEKSKKSPKTKLDDKDLRIINLEKELEQAREDMRRITEDQESINEELQSANEELLSSSEELQSLNEELETGKEELQSTNEELTVMNQEMGDLISQLKEEKKYVQAIVETTRTPLLVLDKQLRVKSANAAYYKTFRSNEAETEGKLIYELGNHQWNIATLKEGLEKILPEKSKLNDYEVNHNFVNIGERIMLLNARELIRENSDDKLILLTIDDITELRLAEYDKVARIHMEFIADNMPQKVWTADANGNVNYFNKSWLEYTGLSFKDLKDWGWKKTVHPDDWEENKRLWQHSIDTGEDFELEHRFMDKDGNYIWHLSRGVAFKDENQKVKLWVGTNTEIQTHKEYNNMLENEVLKRTKDLRNANLKLESNNQTLLKINKELESFAYISSHDLQEPLRKIQFLASRISEKESENLSETGRDLFQRMHKSAKRMQSLIQDLLTYSRTAAKKEEFEITDLNQIIADVQEDFSQKIIDSGAIIETQLSKANVIPFQFNQLFSNLISNSLKFQSKKRTPKIQISSEVIKGENCNLQKLKPKQWYCHITYSDNGIGFEPEFSDKIFEVFKRLHNNENYPGTGIGLAIVKKIVDSHEGEIEVTSELDIGVTFDIYLPHVK